MRLFSTMGATTVDDPKHGHFDVDTDGGVDLPHELAEELHSFAIGGRPMWETPIERNQRLVHEEMERRKDPATLLDAVNQLVSAAQAAKPEPESPKTPPTPAPAPPA